MSRLILKWGMILALLMALPTHAQQLKFSIAGFEQDFFDTSAQSAKHQKKDGSGSLYAIIKVKSNNPDDNLREYQFNFGQLKHIIDQEDHGDELWIYVQKNAKMVTISRPGYKPISRHDLGLNIQAGKNYVMQLESAAKPVFTQMTRFSVTPPDVSAVVLVKSGRADAQEELFGITSTATGEITGNLEYGFYTYRVLSAGCHTVEGRFTLDKRNEIHPEPIKLRPKAKTAAAADSQMVRFRMQPVDSRAIVLVKRSGSDDPEELFGIADERTGATERFLTKGTYEYRVVSADYRTEAGTISVAGKHSVAEQTVDMQPNFGTVTLTVDADADIYINNRRQGTRSWTGRLKAGTYPIECRMDNHRPKLQYVRVVENTSRTLELEKPEPIVGTLSLLCKPEAKITIDGKDYGVTPRNIEILIGSHSVTFSRENYKPHTQTVIVSENQVTSLESTLQDFTRMTIDSRPEGATLRINGDSVGITPYESEMTSGLYTLQLSYPGYRPFEQRVHLDSSSPYTMLRLSRQLQKPTSFYVQAGAQAGTLMGVSASIGAYLHNFNVEATATMGMVKETMYLNYTDNSGADSRLQELKPLALGGRLGYGIIIGTRMRITPQVGAQLLSVKSADVKGYAICATAGLRFECALAPCLGLSATGEGTFAASKSESFEKVATLSSKVKGWGTGGNLRLGVYLFF